MKSALRHVATITLGLVVYAGLADAQEASPIKFGIGGGLTIPTGDAGKGLDNGFHVMGMIGWAPADFPLGFRGEVGYHSLKASVGDGKFTILGGGANAMWMFPMAESAIRPYVTGGVGVYRAKSESGGFDASDTKFGANGGGGVMFDLSGFGAFVEARYLSVFTEGQSTNLIPITFGVMFGGR